MLEEHGGDQLAGECLRPHLHGEWLLVDGWVAVARCSSQRSRHCFPVRWPPTRRAMATQSGLPCRPFVLSDRTAATRRSFSSAENGRRSIRITGLLRSGWLGLRCDDASTLGGVLEVGKCSGVDGRASGAADDTAGSAGA